MNRGAFKLSLLSKARGEQSLAVLVEIYRRGLISNFLESNSSLRESGWGAYQKLCGSGKLSQSMLAPKSLRDRNLAEFLYLTGNREDFSLPLGQKDMDIYDSILDDYILCASAAERQKYINDLVDAEPRRTIARPLEVAELKSIVEVKGRGFASLQMGKNVALVSPEDSIGPEALGSLARGGEPFDYIFVDTGTPRTSPRAARGQILVAAKILEDRDSGRVLVLCYDSRRSRPEPVFLEHLRRNFSEMPLVIAVDGHATGWGRDASDGEPMASLRVFLALAGEGIVSKMAREIAKSGLEAVLGDSGEILEVLEPVQQTEKLSKDPGSTGKAPGKALASGRKVVNSKSIDLATEEFEGMEVSRHPSRPGRTNKNGPPAGGNGGKKP
ncbi:MAG: hypothetical protein LBU15_03435 [Rickettsiales bacterium]|jgi:hypothetical protein|nr:hypothetical protein [Rickettsiales bacterium]